MKKILSLLFVAMLLSCGKKKDPFPERAYNVKFEVSFSSPNDLSYEVLLNERIMQSGGSIKSAYYYFTPGRGDKFRIYVIYKDTISIKANYGDEIIKVDTALNHAQPYGYDEKQTSIVYTVK